MTRGLRGGKLFDARHPDLRLQVNKSGYEKHKWTGSYNVRVILVGKSAEAIKDRQPGEKVNLSIQRGDQKLDYRVAEIYHVRDGKISDDRPNDSRRAEAFSRAKKEALQS